MDLRTISENGSLYFYPRLELRHGISMYVKTYLDLSLRSLVVFWCCFLARVPGSLAGGFLVAVAGCALFAVCLFLRDFVSNGSVYFL